MTCASASITRPPNRWVASPSRVARCGPTATCRQAAPSPDSRNWPSRRVRRKSRVGRFSARPVTSRSSRKTSSSKTAGRSRTSGWRTSACATSSSRTSIPIGSSSSSSVIKLAPRLGVTWDVFGDSTFKVYANAGRYRLAVPLTSPSVAPARSCSSASTSRLRCRRSDRRCPH